MFNIAVAVGGSAEHIVFITSYKKKNKHKPTKKEKKSVKKNVVSLIIFSRDNNNNVIMASALFRLYCHINSRTFPFMSQISGEGLTFV